MQLETLKVFCDIVETRSFATAASKNFVTPSAVSQVVRMLEQRYGCQLLERTRGNLQLTPAGEVLYQASKEIVDRYQDMEARLQALTGVVAGTVRVGTVHSIGLPTGRNVALETDHGLAAELLHRYPPVRRQRVPGGASEDQAVLPNGDDDDAGPLLRVGHHPEIDVAVGGVVVDLVGPAVLEGQVDLRVRL